MFHYDKCTLYCKNNLYKYSMQPFHIHRKIKLAIWICITRPVNVLCTYTVIVHKKLLLDEVKYIEERFLLDIAKSCKINTCLNPIHKNWKHSFCRSQSWHFNWHVAMLACLYIYTCYSSDWLYLQVYVIMVGKAEPRKVIHTSVAAYT